MRHALVTITTVIVLALGTPAAAEMFYDKARVLDAQPVYEPREVPVSVQQCGYEQSFTAGPVDRAMLGDARTAAPGADLPDALQRDMELRAAPSDVYRCRMVTRTESQPELAGYRVRYEYDGRVYERRMAEPPGDTIRVGVELTVAQSNARRLR
jgi:hypothetical protein